MFEYNSDEAQLMAWKEAIKTTQTYRLKLKYELLEELETESKRRKKQQELEAKLEKALEELNLPLAWQFKVANGKEKIDYLNKLELPEETNGKIQGIKQLINTLIQEINTSKSASSRLDKFEERRKTLLSDEHNQGWSWIPNLNWLWSIISFFLPIRINFQPGSALRQTLEKDITPPKVELLSLPDNSETSEIKFLNEENFQEAVFFNPHKALVDIQARMQKTSDDQPETILKRLGAIKPRLGFEAYNALLTQFLKKFPQVEINAVQLKVEQLNAIKFLLSPETYRKHLDALFQEDSKTCLRYHLTLYLEDQHEIPKPQEYIEHHLMARTLIKSVVPPTSNEGELDTLYAIHKLIAILGSTAEISENSHLLRLIFTMKLDDAYKPVYEKLEGKPPEGIPLDFAKKNFSLSHPLLIQVTRLACEEILYNYPINRQPNEMEHLTLNFLVETALHKLRFGASAKLEHPDNRVELINPHAHGMLVPTEYQRAEHSALMILMHAANSENDGLAAARAIRSKYNHSPMERDWIFARVNDRQPQLLSKLDYIFNKVTFYDTKDLSSLPKLSDDNPETTSLISVIQDCLTTANKAAANYDAATENQANQLAFRSLYQLINHPQLNSEQLDIIFYNLIPRLQHSCITTNLADDWFEQVKTNQQKILRWSASNANIDSAELQSLNTNPDLRINSIFATSKGDIEKADRLYDAAISTSHQKPMMLLNRSTFIAQKTYSQLAVHYFSQFMQDPKNTTKGRQLLEKLKVYLTEDQYRLWATQLNKMTSPVSPSSANEAFFSPKSEIGKEVTGNNIPLAILSGRSEIY
ncbi:MULTISPECIES: hypothetical protein [unclassified Legionella]|uniref:hypothetical protein n=1 Tax=unclassified Legionella TaxID=2622702 RepID=UPI001056B59C|nr:MULTISPECIES: hypothetical protein [unclassified Legionella]MDI9817873.1 hypothetical protein [Legionella sp. PL877]